MTLTRTLTHPICPDPSRRPSHPFMAILNPQVTASRGPSRTLTQTLTPTPSRSLPPLKGGEREMPLAIRPGMESPMLDPKDVADVDEATALGIATLWNDAVPAVQHALDHQILDIEEGIRLAHECDREDCETHGGVLHRNEDDSCRCWGCDHAGVLVMAVDALMWIEDIDDGSPNLGPSDCSRLLSLVGDCLYVNEQAPRTTVPAYKLGPVYRLLAELADQVDAYLQTLMVGDTGGPRP